MRLGRGAGDNRETVPREPEGVGNPIKGEQGMEATGSQGIVL